MRLSIVVRDDPIVAGGAVIMPDRSERLARFIGDFLALRPMFTRTGLRVIWYAYLLYQALIFFFMVLNLRFAPGQPLATWYSFIAAALFPLIKIGVVRLLLELAGVLLSRYSEAYRA
jgi:hypothetical protein